MNTVKSLFKGLALKYLPESILIGLKQRHYARMLRTFSEENEITFRIVKYLVSPGDSVVDLGANIGVYTKYLSSLVGEKGRVHSFEPIPHTFRILTSITKRLQLSNVRPYNFAISDVEGSFTMQVPALSGGGEDFYQAIIIDDRPEYIDEKLRRIKVQSRRLDSLLANVSDKISFIKCDVEGHELRCIKGAREIIDRSQPAWLIEVNRDPDDPKQRAFSTFRLMQEQGYHPCWFDGHKLRLREKGTRWRDYFFFTNRQVKMLEDAGLFT